jgi:hypothetical protein
MPSGGKVIVEYWTESRDALVLTGEKVEVTCVAAVLGVSLDNVTDVGPSKVALALWGADLRAYLRSEAAALATAERVGAYTTNTRAVTAADAWPTSTLIHY